MDAMLHRVPGGTMLRNFFIIILLMISTMMGCATDSDYENDDPICAPPSDPFNYHTVYNHEFKVCVVDECDLIGREGGWACVEGCRRQISTGLVRCRLK